MEIQNKGVMKNFPYQELFEYMSNEQCPKCKSRFGLIISEKLFKQKKNLCLNGDCDFENEEIDDYIRQEFLAKKSGMTDEQILNGEHFDIEFND